ncbi:hypothetical protein NMG60_11002713 [Bertholletia excelsa]
MARTSYFPVFLTLLLLRPLGGAAIIIPVVHITSRMPENIAPVNLNCKKADGSIEVENYPLAADQTYEWIAKDNEDSSCRILWGKKIGSIDAYVVARDSGYPDTYWVVEDDGFYLSHDNTNFAKQGVWLSG